MVKTRLTEKKIEEVVRSACGDDVIPLIKKLHGKENVSEFKLADQLKEDIKRVRNILYRLYESNLVDFSRKKDKKKGWYIYYWTFKPEQIKFIYNKLKKEQIEQLKELLKNGGAQQLFICPNKCAQMNFEQAVTLEYKCPECGLLTIQEKKEEQVTEIKKKITALEKEISAV